MGTAASHKQGLIILITMFIVLLGGLAIALYSEFNAGNLVNIMEGKETRFGVINSIIWGVSTTAASNGSVNCMHSSLSPLAGAVALFNMMIGEVIFGGVGAGMYGMFMFVFLTVFIAGLMVGRTPEFMGKKIEVREIIFVMVALLVPNMVILIGSAVLVIVPDGLSS
jgi:K+-transporting ATPase ATPase A chain